MLDIGHSQYMDSENKVAIPTSLCIVNYGDLVDFVYSGITCNPPPSPFYFLDHMILALCNSGVTDANQYILDRMVGEEHVFYSADCVVDENNEPMDGQSTVPVEVLCSLNSSNFTPGELHLKVSCPIILLRNLSSATGLCNGTRLVIVCMSTHVIEAQILGGDQNSDVVLIPRITLVSQGTAGDLPLRIC